MTLLPGGQHIYSRWAVIGTCVYEYSLFTVSLFLELLIELLFSFSVSQTDSCAVRGGNALSPVWHHCAEEGWMRLAALHGLSHWDLLGHQRTPLGAWGKKSFPPFLMAYFFPYVPTRSSLRITEPYSVGRLHLLNGNIWFLIQKNKYPYKKGATIPFFTKIWFLSLQRVITLRKVYSKHGS